MAKKMSAKEKELVAFLDRFLYASVVGGIATEKPNKKNLQRFSMAVVKLKQEHCHIDDVEEFKKKMPFYFEVEDAPMKQAEGGRIALKEVARCSIKAILSKR